jgi:hypothetical protein
MAKSRSNPAGFDPVLTRVETWAHIDVASKGDAAEATEQKNDSRIEMSLGIGARKGFPLTL